ncbi:MAG: NmrA family NAD(P)-binding protein [Aquabacterium sp.]
MVLGGAGAQGSAIARALLAQGQRVKVLVRSDARDVPAGVQRVEADLGDGDALLEAFKGVTHLTVTLPLVYDQEVTDAYAMNIVRAARHNGVQRLVFNANTRLPASRTGVAAFDTRSSAEAILRGSGMDLVTLQPAVYLENMLAPACLGGMQEHGQLHYPLPASIRVSWLSLGDLGRAVATAHALDKVPAGPVLIGSEPLTGAELAAQLSDAIGRPLTYVPLPPDVFEQSLVGFIGAEAAAGVAGLYHWAFQHPDSALFGAGEGDARLDQSLLPRVASPRDWSLNQPWSRAKAA